MGISTKIIGVGSYLPDTIVTNEMLESVVDTTDQWIRKRTGIHERRVATEDDATTMAVKAANKAIEHAGIDPNDLGIIIGTSVTQNLATPAIANIVQKEIGCEQAACMDLLAGCTGFVYALATLVSMMETLGVETGMIVSSEHLTGRVDWTDRSTCILFGDGAGAVIVQRSERNCIQHPYLNAIHDTDDVLKIPNKMCDNPWSEHLAQDDVMLQMDGKKVFAFAVDAVEKVLNILTERAGAQGIDKIVPHQANSRIIRFVAQNSQYDKEQFYLNIDRYANTSSATIPIALDEAHQKGWLKKGDNIALIGFGAGLTYGGILVEWAL